MSTTWSITFDCHDAQVMAAFWALALGYVEAEPPDGFDTWEEWLVHFEVPEDEWGDGANLVDPDGLRPSIGFLKVPEGKTAKNRLHLDLTVSGGRSAQQDLRETRIRTTVEKLVAAGATVQREDVFQGELDHVVLLDPEGNEFCVV